MKDKKNSFFRKNIIFHTNMGKNLIKSNSLQKVIFYEDDYPNKKMRYKDEENIYEETLDSSIFIWYLLHTDDGNLAKYMERFYKNILYYELFSFAPMKIAIVREGNENFQIVHTKYTWINSIEVLVFNNKDDALKWLQHKVDVNLKLSIKSQLFLSEYPFIPSVDSSLFIIGFYRNALMEQNTFKSIMFYFDYLEFLLLNLFYYGKKLNNEQVLNERIMSYEDLGKEIVRLLRMIDFDIDEEYICDDYLWPTICKEIKRYFGINIDGGTFNFIGLVMVLQQLRNCTKGHGIIVGKSAEVLKSFLMCLSIYLNLAIRLYDLKYSIENDHVFCCYKDYQKIDLNPYVIVIDGCPNILYVNKKKKEYINYFEGNYIIPDIK